MSLKREYDKAMAWLEEFAGTRRAHFYDGGMALETMAVLKELLTAVRQERDQVGKLRARLEPALDALVAWRQADRAQATYERLCAELAEEDDATIDDAAAFALEQAQIAREQRDTLLAKARPFPHPTEEAPEEDEAAEAERRAQREREAEARHYGGLSPLGEALAIEALSLKPEDGALSTSKSESGTKRMGDSDGR